MPKGIFARKVRPVIIPVGPSIAYIPLTKGKFAKIDIEDISLTQGNWFAHCSPKSKNFYAVRNIPRIGGGQVTQRMNRLILQVKITDDRLGDHKNGDSLDNRRDNIRPATYIQNSRNRNPEKTSKSGNNGITVTTHGRFWVRIMVEGKRITLGCRKDISSAIELRKEGEKKYFGEFARQ